MKKNYLILIIRVFVLIFSFVGFLYQNSQLLSIYLSRETRVQNRVERLVFSELPAITVCLPSYVSMKRLADHLLKVSTISVYREFANDYLKFSNGFKAWNDKTINAQKDIYSQMKDNFLDMNVSLAEIFDKIAIQDLTMINYSALAIHPSGNLSELIPPITFRSLVPFSDPRLCFTYFSELDPNYRQGTKYKLIRLDLRFRVDRHDFPFDEYENGDFYVALHSANLLPRYVKEDSFRKIKLGVKNSISYKENQARLLPFPYKTDCRWYELSDRPDAQMRSDCIQQCTNEAMLKQFPLNQCIFTATNYNLMRENKLGQFANLSLCNYPRFTQETLQNGIKMLHLFDHKCRVKCRHSCIVKYYDFSVGVSKVHSLIQSDDQFAVFVQHYRLPDELVEHKPQMTWIELVSSFGGLLGMWLGLSVAFLLDSVITFLFTSLKSRNPFPVGPQMPTRGLLYYNYGSNR